MGQQTVQEGEATVVSSEMVQEGSINLCICGGL
jgi:hypothetical protein